MRTTRLIAAVLFSLFFISILSWKRNTIPDYLPEEAHRYFHPDGAPSAPTALDQVIDNLINGPILTYDESVTLNSETCPTTGVNYDVNAVEGNLQNWREIPSTKISDWRHEIAAFLDSKQGQEKDDKTVYSGRGVVMAAGDRDAVIRARTNIRFLRSYNCTLPVEIFHFSTELSAPDKQLLEDLSKLEVDGKKDMKVTVRVVEGISKGTEWKAFQIKGAAIQQSSFDEILYLDTDSYLLRNPESLFSSQHWRDTGLLLWPDYTKSHPTNPLWRLLGQPCRNEYEGESGQIAISRTRHREVLWLVEYFALHHEEFYGFMGGDRDSFRAAALLLGRSWRGPKRLNAAAGVNLDGFPNGGGHTMLQSDMDGKWMFVHANLIKHSRFPPRPLWAKIHRVKNDKFEGSSTYGSIDEANTKLGDGVRLTVDSAPKMVSTMEPIEGYDIENRSVVVEDWDTYEELRGFEEKWFGFGGVHY